MCLCRNYVLVTLIFKQESTVHIEVCVLSPVMGALFLKGLATFSTTPFSDSQALGNVRFVSLMEYLLLTVDLQHVRCKNLFSINLHTHKQFTTKTMQGFPESRILLK